MTQNPWVKAEIVLVPFIFIYFLFYPRDTISDFVVCSTLSFVILGFGKNLGLHKPETGPFNLLDLMLLGITLPAFIGAWIYAALKQKVTTDNILEYLVIICLYFYYAWIQHFLAQRYTALRIKGFMQASTQFPSFSIELKAAFLTGCIFGILHIPYPGLMLPAAIGGGAYAYYFLKTGRLWAVVSSHALIASAWIYWALDANAFEEFSFIFPLPL